MKKISFVIIYGCLMCAATMTTTAQTYSGGSGTETDPFLISSNADMVTLAVAVNNGTDYSKNKYFLLTQNLTGINTVIGNSTTDDTKAFQGVFDGGEYILDVNSIIGVFGRAIGATIKNMGMSGSINTTSEGGLCAIASNTIFSNCFNRATILCGGGVVGIANGCTIFDCYNFGEIGSGENVRFGTRYFGGIVGKAIETTINNCYNEGNIYGHNSYLPYGQIYNIGYAYAGGICGDGQDLSINNSYNKRNVRAVGGSGAHAGGILGTGNTIFITNCYNTGNVTNSTSIAGGIVGYISDITSSVTNCFNACSSIAPYVSYGGVSRAGRITGYSGTSTTHVFWCYSLSSTLVNGATVTSTDATSIDGIDGFIENFQSQTWIAGNLGWDFTNTWYMPASPVGYPLLKRLCTVAFDAQGGSSVTSATAYTGEKITRPADPIRSGFTFGGWYKETACTNIWDFDTDVVTANMTLYAKWTVLPIITINTQPAATTNVTAGSISGYLIISASVTPSAALSYQWYSATANSNTDGSVVSGATSSTFAIPATLTAAGSPYYYFCEVRSSGAVPERSNVATVNVNTLVNAQTPNITVHPQPAIYTQSAAATPLTVTASVTDGGTLSYQWFSNMANSTAGGTAVGTNSASYTPPTAAAGTRYYYVVITNTNNSVSGTKTATATSNTAAVTVTIVEAEVPIITSHPQSATYTQNTTATALTVAAYVTDGGTLSYQWFSNTANNNYDGIAISGPTGTSYTPPTATVGTVYYYVMVVNTNLSGTHAHAVPSNTAAVTVNAIVNAQMPNITAHPQPATYVQNASATPLTVTASVTDGGTLSYQWYSNTANGTTGGTAVGTNSASYTPPTTTVGMRYYYVVITNTNNSVNGTKTVIATSNTAAVTVNPLVNAQTPNITAHPQPATYVQNASATPLTVTASITDGGTLTYQWYSNTMNSTTGGTAVGTSSASYTPSTTTAGTRYYYVVITNTNNSASGTKTATATSNTAAITVNALVNAQMPSITAHPQPAIYVQNASATPLTVTASVTDGGTLSYQWYSNTANGTAGGTAVGTNSAGYTPPTTTVGMMYYYVVVTNTNNSVNGTKTVIATSNTAAVTVSTLVNAQMPNITAHPQPASYTQNVAATPLSVMASVTDGGTLTYQWYKNATNSTTGGTAVGTGTSYTPSTSTVGTQYYYVVITNANNSVNGVKTATATSNTATVTVTSGIVPAEQIISFIGSAFTTTPNAWDVDFDLQYISTDENSVSLYAISNISFIDGGEFKLRHNHAWTTSWGTGITNISDASSNIVNGNENDNLKSIANCNYATVEFRINWGTGECSLTFPECNAGIVPITGITLNKAIATLTVGNTEQLIPIIEPVNATNKNVTWTSSNTGVATVSNNGTVTAISAGVAYITVTTQDGGKTFICAVTVTQVTGVEISETSHARVYPNPTDGAVTLHFETAGEYVITITDISGKILLRQTDSAPIVQLNISHFPAGVYLLTIDDGKRQSVVQVVKE